MDQDRNLDLDAVRADDEFLTALSKGTDPSGGEDQLAGMLLDLQREVDAPMPPAPEDVIPAGFVSDGSDVSLGRHRRASRKNRSMAHPRPLVSGLIGAAAATLLIAGVGAVAFDNFVPRDSVSEVELAGDLEELEKLSANGDSAGVLDRVAEMRKRLGISDSDGAGTVTRTRTEPPEKETVVETEGTADGAAGENDREVRGGDPEPADVHTVTETVERPAPGPADPGAARPDADGTGGDKEKATETVVVTETVTAPGDGRDGVYQPDLAPEQPSEPANLDELLRSDSNS